MESKQVTITQISRKDKVAASGKPYVSLGIKTQEYGDVWLSGFSRKDNANWKVGDTVTVMVEQKGQYLNFSMPTVERNAPSKDGDVARLLNMMEFKVMPVLQYLFEKEKAREVAKEIIKDDFVMPFDDGPEDNIQPEDRPF